MIRPKPKRAVCLDLVDHHCGDLLTLLIPKIFWTTSLSFSDCILQDCPVSRKCRQLLQVRRLLPIQVAARIVPVQARRFTPPNIKATHRSRRKNSRIQQEHRPKTFNGRDKSTTRASFDCPSSAMTFKIRLWLSGMPSRTRRSGS